MKTDDKIEQGARLEQLIKHFKLTQSAFAQIVMLKQSNVSAMVSGRKIISPDSQKKISERYRNLNLNWLLNGEGEMFLEKLEKKYEQSEGRVDVVSEPVEAIKPALVTVDLSGLLARLGELESDRERDRVRIEELEVVVTGLLARLNEM